MSEFFKGIREFFSEIFASPSKSIAILVVCLLLLFAPNTLKQSTGLGKIIESYGAYIYIVGAISLSSLIIQSSRISYNYIMAKLNASKARRERDVYLSSLQYYEKLVLSKFIGNKSKSYILDANSGAVIRLQAAGIIYPAGHAVQTLTIYDEVPTLKSNYIIIDHAYNLLIEHPEYLQLTAEEQERYNQLHR